MQYGHCMAWATASAMSDFSRADSAPSLNTALYQAKNFGSPETGVGGLRRFREGDG